MRLSRLFNNSLTPTVPDSDGVTSPQELNKLIDSHGPKGLNISAEMITMWQRALLYDLELGNFTAD
ncbi:hypothetical protein [Alteromonas sp. AMM-1]|uniref:hypothetical protein n=1 Tax=Alteromonas sp. AMM-1 TaxID=3394233 RepID=UPI0039A784A2